MRNGTYNTKAYLVYTRSIYIWPSSLCLLLFAAFSLLKSCPDQRSIYTSENLALAAPLLYVMKPLSLVVGLQAACLTQALPVLEAQTPNDILAAGVQSLSSPSETPETLGVCLLMLVQGALR